MDRVVTLVAALSFYADPANWREEVDDRGRETLRFRFAEDGGAVAARALKEWSNATPE